MNKALIKRHKTEFDHWLNGGELLIGYKSKFEPIEWNVLVEDDWDYCIGKHIIVINDEYVELRKALAEGKTIQYLPDDSNEWKDCINQTSPSRQFLTHISKFRIKPIKFKLGDYVKLTSTTHIALRTYPSWFQIDGKDITLHGSYINIERGQHSFHFNELELWQPTPNEWCWFWDKPNSVHATLIKFHSLYGNKFKSNSCVWNYCTPFIGELPEHLKD